MPGAAPVARTRREFDVDRVVSAGGDLAQQMLLDAFSPFERLYRREPEEGMFDPGVSSSNPVGFELGAFTVPPNMTFHSRTSPRSTSLNAVKFSNGRSRLSM